jgi:hypothetical protein
MFDTPRFEQLPVEALVVSGICFGLGRFAHVNAPLAATVALITTLANHLLFQFSDRFIQPLLKLSSEAIYTGTDAIVTITAFVAAEKLNLISRSVEGALIFISLLTLAARIKILCSSCPVTN